jgi:hypothetical protein
MRSKLPPNDAFIRLSSRAAEGQRGTSQTWDVLFFHGQTGMACEVPRRAAPARDDNFFAGAGFLSADTVSPNEEIMT